MSFHVALYDGDVSPLKNMKMDQVSVILLWHDIISVFVSGYYSLWREIRDAAGILGYPV